MYHWLECPVSISLLYRGTVHDITPIAFHGHCDKQGPTVTLVKSESGRVFGGFTSVSWRSPSKLTVVKDFRAFLFSVTLGQKYPIKHFHGPAVVHYKDFMAVFGRETLRDMFLQRNDRKPNNNTSDFGANFQLPKAMVTGSK